MMPRKSIVAGLVIVLIIGVAIGYFLQNGTLNFSSSSPSNPFSGYKKLTLVLSQGDAVQFGNSYYSFWYIGPSSDLFQQGKLKFGMIAGLATTKIYDDIEGAKYNDLGIEMINWRSP